MHKFGPVFQKEGVLHPFQSGDYFFINGGINWIPILYL